MCELSAKCEGCVAGSHTVLADRFGKKCRPEEFVAGADFFADDDRMVIEVLSLAQA